MLVKNVFLVHNVLFLETENGIGLVRGKLGEGLSREDAEENIDNVALSEITGCQLIAIHRCFILAMMQSLL